MYLKRLRDLREDSDLRQRQLAEILNIKQQQYSLYETGKRELPLQYALELARFYHTSIDYLVEKTDVKEPYPKK